MTDALLDVAFELAGQISEQTLELCDLAADVEDRDLSTAAFALRQDALTVGDVIAKLRQQARSAAA